MTTIHQALNAAMLEVGAVGKDSFNEQQRFNFRGIDAVVNAVAPAFRAHGIVVTPVLSKIDYTTVTTAKGSQMSAVRVIVEYVFSGPEGDAISAIVAAEAFDSGDKATAKAMSVAYRTALLQTLCLPTDEPDPDSYTYVQEAPAPVEVPGLTTLAAKLRHVGDTAARKNFVIQALGLDADWPGTLKDLNEAQINAVLTALDTK
jgi:hypothetical protein